jgi:hypothetical protein
MNFLLHRRLALDELGSPHAAVGAMLPDLWRMADRRMRARDAVPLPAENLLELERGVAHHLEADRWFHRHAVFREGEATTASHLRGAAGADLPKLGLFAHAAWEMCLDGALLSRRGVKAELAALRADLDDVGCAPAVALALHHRGAGRAADDASFPSRMERIWTALGEGSWIAGYCQPDGLAAALIGMRLRFGLQAPDAPARDRLSGALGDVLATALPAVDRLLAERALGR